MCQKFVARPVIAGDRVCVITQIKRIARGPNLSISLPIKGEITAKTSMAKVCADDRVALSKWNSSRIGLKKILIATALTRKVKTQEAATIYQPKNNLWPPCAGMNFLSFNRIYPLLHGYGISQDI